MTREQTQTLSEISLAGLQERARRLRVLSLLATARAGSGHPTSCLSAAELATALFFWAMRYDPQDPFDPEADRVVFSKGHAAPLLYAALAEAGSFPPSALLALRRFHSPLEGHPTPRLPWVDVATGSLGQGLAVGVGMALSGKYLEGRSFRVFVLMGDGEMAEGSVWEAAALAAHYRLDNLTALVDINGWGQSGPPLFGQDPSLYEQRLRAFGWHTRTVDGHSLPDLVQALTEARRVQGRPTAILARTVKGKGVSFLEGRVGWHGKPLREEELAQALRELGVEGVDLGEPVPVPAPLRPPAPTVPASEVPPPHYWPGQEVATREAYGNALAKLGQVSPRVVCLDGDVKNSTFAERFLTQHPRRYVEAFIAEQAMVGMAMGLAARGWIPFASTFAAFLSRAHDQIRMAGISGANIKLVGSHAGVSIGADGPSQMGLEDLAMMRSVPGCVVLYPCDAVSCERLVAEAAAHPGMVYLRTTRPPTPVLYANEERFPIGGSKVLRADPQDRVTVVAAGITVHEALKAAELLQGEGIRVRVVDAYSLKPLDREGLARSARETGGRVITVEDHYAEGGLGEAVLSALAPLGARVRVLAVREVPRSGSPAELMDAYGIGARRIAEAVREFLQEVPG